MGFIHSFGAAKQLLQSMKKGTCHGRCRTGWLRNIKYALKTKSNPLKLTSEQKKELKTMIKDISGKRIQPKLWLGPTIPAYKRMGKKMRGKDGGMYIAVPKKNSKYGKWVKYSRYSSKLKKNTVSKKVRPSPTESATKFCGKRKRGNDGNMYISKPNKNGVCRWVKVK